MKFIHNFPIGQCDINLIMTVQQRQQKHRSVLRTRAVKSRQMSPLPIRPAWYLAA